MQAIILKGHMVMVDEITLYTEKKIHYLKSQDILCCRRDHCITYILKGFHQPLNQCVTEDLDKV